jgi:hypothetical protein
LPQKRRTLSSGFSQYQHDPLAGRLWREGVGGATAATIGSAAAFLSGKLSCIVSTIPPYPAAHHKNKITSAKYLEHEKSQAQLPYCRPRFDSFEPQFALNGMPLQRCHYSQRADEASQQHALP